MTFIFAIRNTRGPDPTRQRAKHARSPGANGHGVTGELTCRWFTMNDDERGGRPPRSSSSAILVPSLAATGKGGTA